MGIANLKDEMIEIGTLMYENGFAPAHEGNISVRCGKDRILITPVRVSKRHMRSEMIVLCDLEGYVIDSTPGYLPSAEMPMHLKLYNENPRINAVVHAHPPVATSFAVAGVPLDRKIYTGALDFIGDVPVSKYARPSTAELADAVAPFCREYNKALLLQNHGVVTWGVSLLEAWHRMEAVEQYAKITMNSVYIIKKFNVIDEEEVKKISQD